MWGRNKQQILNLDGKNIANDHQLIELLCVPKVYASLSAKIE